MPHIDVNFDDVPDEVKPLAAGIYTFRVISAVIEPTKKDETKEKVVLGLEVDMEGSEYHGRKHFEHIGFSSDRGRTTLKQIMMAAGVPTGPNGLDVDDLIGQTLQARIKARTYKDPDTGEIREAAGVAGWLWREEDIKAAAVV